MHLQPDTIQIAKQLIASVQVQIGDPEGQMKWARASAAAADLAAYEKFLAEQPPLEAAP